MELPSPAPASLPAPLSREEVLDVLLPFVGRHSLPVGCHISVCSVHQSTSGAPARHTSTCYDFVYVNGSALVQLPPSPPRPPTRYAIGSLSKMFTAVAIMQLYEAAKLSLDAEVGTMLPEFSHERFRGVTPRRLLTHYAGICRIAPLSAAEESDHTRLPSTLTELAQKIALPPLLHPPGTGHIYSNAGYTILGLLVERLSGRTFQQYIEEEVFARLGMTESGFMHVSGTECLAQGHCNKGRATPAAIIWSGPAGGVISTISDMARFAAGLLGSQEGVNSRPLLRPDTLREMFTDQHRLVASQPDVPASTPAWGLGPGLAPRTFRRELLPAVHHNGVTQSFRSDLLLLPSKGVAAVVLLAARHEGFPLARITTQLVKRTLGESVQPPVGGQDLEEL